MRLRSIIRTISVSLTTAIIVSCTTSCGNNILTDVYAVRYAGEDDWKMLPSIEGFEYECGYYME